MINWRKYQVGDLRQIKHREPEPFEGWLEFAEEHGRGMATITLDGTPLAVIGCTPCWDGVADCFAVVDRERAHGHGRVLASMSRARIDQAMQVLRIHRMQATTPVTDRAAQVFLRAIGFRRESTLRQGAPDRSDLYVYAYLQG